MACGTPVITSNTTSLNEICQGAGFLVDPSNVELITKKIEESINNPILATDNVRKGFNRAKDFSWNKTKKILLLNLFN